MILHKVFNNYLPLSSDVPHIARLYAQIFHYYSYNVSPHAAFALGMGLSFEYMRGENFRLSPDFTVEGMYFGGSFSKDRRRLAKNLCIWLDVYRGSSHEKAYENYRSMLAQGMPLIVEVNLELYYDFLKDNYEFYLEDNGLAKQIYDIPQGYYINGYSIILAGLDEETKNMVCLDANLRGSIEIPYQEFMEMHSCKTKFIAAEYEWTDILMPKHKELHPPEHAMLEAIRQDIKMLEFPVIFNDDYVIGIEGMRTLYSDALHNDGLFSSKQMRQSIDKIYYMSEVLYGKTGLYRKTYADFLSEASEYHPALIEAARKYEQLGTEWSYLLELIKNKECNGKSKSEFLHLLEKIIISEEAACKLLNECTIKH